MGNKQSLFLSTDSGLFLSKARPQQNAATQRTSFRTLPESPLLSQKQAKLVFIHQSPVHTKKHSYTKGLSPHPSRIAASIAKTSEACFIHNSALFLSKARSSQKTPYTKGFFPHPSRIAASIAKTSEACFYPQLWLISLSVISAPL